MRKRTVIITTAIVIVILIAIAVISSGYIVIESPAEFGKWGQTIELVDKDGNAMPMTFGGLPFFAFVYNNNEFVGFNYKLSAKASGTDYSTVSINIKNYGVYVTIAGYMLNLSYNNQQNTTILVDNSWYQIINTYVDMNSLVPPGFPPGTYDISFIPYGEVKYNPDNTVWYNAILPPTFSFTITATGSGNLQFVIDQAVDITYSTLILRPMGDVSGQIQLNQYPANTSVSYDNVNEETADDDVSYVYRRGLYDGDPTGYHDLFELQNENVITSPIEKVTFCSVLKTCIYCQLPGYCNYAVIAWFSHALRFPGDTQIYLPPAVSSHGHWPETTPYVMHSYTYEKNPKTGQNWTWADINSLQAGPWIRCGNGGQGYLADGRVTQYYIIVKYSV